MTKLDSSNTQFSGAHFEPLFRVILEYPVRFGLFCFISQSTFLSFFDSSHDTTLYHRLVYTSILAIHCPSFNPRWQTKQTSSCLAYWHPAFARSLLHLWARVCLARHYERERAERELSQQHQQQSKTVPFSFGGGGKPIVSSILIIY